MWWEQGLGRANGEAGEGKLFFGGSLRRRIFPYATHSKSTSIFNVVWSELQIHHALHTKSGHTSIR